MKQRSFTSFVLKGKHDNCDPFQKEYDDPLKKIRLLVIER